MEIVRIDNVGKPLHMDQLWKEGNPKKELDWKGDKWELFYRSYRELKENWREYARRWSQNEL